MFFVLNILCLKLFNRVSLKSIDAFDKYESHTKHQYRPQSINISELVQARLYGDKNVINNISIRDPEEFNNIRIHEKLVNDIIEIFFEQNAANLIPMFLAISKVGNNSIKFIKSSWETRKESYGLIPVSSYQTLKLVGDIYVKNPTLLNNFNDKKVLTDQIIFFINHLCEGNVNITFKKVYDNLKMPINAQNGERENFYKYYIDNIKNYQNDEMDHFNNSFINNFQHKDYFNEFLMFLNLDKNDFMNDNLQKIIINLLDNDEIAQEKVKEMNIKDILNRIDSDLQNISFE